MSIGDQWTGVILAGGLGSRLFPLTQEIPKPLVKVANKPMLDYAIDHLRYAGIKKIVIVLKHLAEKIREHMENNWFNNPERLGDLEIHIPHVDSRDTADALRKVEDLVQTDYVLVSMGDIVTNLPLKRFLEYHMEKNGIATISMKEIDEPRQYGVVLIDENNKIYNFLEKPDTQELYLSSFVQRSDHVLARNLINTGIYAFKNDILDLLRNDMALMDFGKHVFPFLLENGQSIYGFVESYYWMDVGQPRPYLWANWDLLRKYAWPITPRGDEHDGTWYDHRPPICGENVSIGKPTAFGNDVIIGNGSEISELCVIDDNVTVGNGARIERSTIWKNVKIGDNTRIFESIICNDAVIGKNVVITGCVVGPGAIIANDQTREYESIVRSKNDSSARD